MKKPWKLLTVGLLSMALLAGCSGGETGGTTETAGEEGANWPNGPVEVVLHAAAGGDTDFNARTFGQYFEEITGQPLVVTNMDGAGGSIATQNVMDAPADGSKALFVHTGPLVVNEVSGLVDYGFDAFDVSTIPAVDTGTVIVASKQSGLTSYEDVVKKAQAAPGEVIFGTELGNYSHLQVLRLQDEADIEFKLADVGSTSDKVSNMLGGRIDLAAIAYGSVKDYIETGDMVAIGQFGAERNELLGDIPTFTEKGLELAMDKPYIIAFPEGTDPAIVERMSDIAVEISEIPEYAEQLEKGFSQEVKVYETDEAIEYLNSIRDEYMQYKDDLSVGAN